MKTVKRSELTQSLLREYLYYDEVTGVFTWLKNTHRFKNFVGKRAGSISKRDSHVEIRFMGTLYRAHILAWLYTYGSYPKNHIDHVDHNEANNSMSNLRDVTQRENNKNMSRKRTNTSGVTGVWVKPTKTGHLYIAEIMDKGKKISLGSYDSLGAAATARKIAEVKLNFHPNHGMHKPI